MRHWRFAGQLTSIKKICFQNGRVRSPNEAGGRSSVLRLTEDIDVKRCVPIRDRYCSPVHRDPCQMKSWPSTDVNRNFQGSYVTVDCACRGLNLDEILT